nr:uncharacterized protein LOC112498821 [Ipomoea batatas]
MPTALPDIQTAELEMAYASLEINEEETEGLELEQSDDLRFSLVGRFLTDKTVKFPFMRDTMATVWKPEGSGSTGRISSPDIKDNSTTDFIRDGQVSTIATTNCTENKPSSTDVVMGQLEEKHEEIGLTILDQKRKRVEHVGPELEPNSQLLDIHPTIFIQKNGPRAGPGDQARPPQ